MFFLILKTLSNITKLVFRTTTSIQHFSQNKTFWLQPLSLSIDQNAFYCNPFKIDFAIDLIVKNKLVSKNLHVCSQKKLNENQNLTQQAFFLLPHHWSKFRIFLAKWEMCCAVYSVHSHITLPVTQVNCCCALLSAGSTTGSCRVIFSVLLSTGSHWYRTVTAVLLLRPVPEHSGRSLRSIVRSSPAVVHHPYRSVTYCHSLSLISLSILCVHKFGLAANQYLFSKTSSTNIYFMLFDRSNS